MFVCRIKEKQATSIYPSHYLKLIKIDFFVLFRDKSINLASKRKEFDELATMKGLIMLNKCHRMWWTMKQQLPSVLSPWMRHKWRLRSVTTDELSEYYCSIIYVDDWRDASYVNDREMQSWALVFCRLKLGGMSAGFSINYELLKHLRSMRIDANCFHDNNAQYCWKYENLRVKSTAV